MQVWYLKLPDISSFAYPDVRTASIQEELWFIVILRLYNSLVILEYKQLL